MTNTTDKQQKIGTGQTGTQTCRVPTHGSFLIRRQRGHQRLPPAISNSANHQEGMQL